MTVKSPLSIHFGKGMINSSNDCPSTSLTVKRYRVRYQQERRKRRGRRWGTISPSYQQSLLYTWETDKLLPLPHSPPIFRPSAPSVIRCQICRQWKSARTANDGTFILQVKYYSVVNGSYRSNPKRENNCLKAWEILSHPQRLKSWGCEEKNYKPTWYLEKVIHHKWCLFTCLPRMQWKWKWLFSTNCLMLSNYFCAILYDRYDY